MKKYVLPVLAVVLLAAAGVILIAVPKKSDGNSSAAVEETAAVQEEEPIEADAGEASEEQAEEVQAALQEGDVIINTADLSEDTISFVRADEESKVELIAIKGEDGTPKVALGTCQSCNGAPGAYYTQTDDMLQCNNCGLTFPLSIIGEDGTGCHPIMLDESLISETADGLVIDKAGLLAMEALFQGVADH